MATPQNTALAFLQREGLVAPENVDPEVDAVPLDFTRLNNREIGALHSRYAVRHAHAIFIAAKLAAQIAMTKRDLKLEQAKYRFKYSQDYKTKYELDDAMAMEDDISDIANLLVVIEGELQIITAVAEGYEDLRNAASREMTRRSTEVGPKD